MPDVLLGVITNGREELLEQTIASIEKNLQYDFVLKVIIDDSGNTEHSLRLQEKYGDNFQVISHATNRGLSGSIRSLWEVAQILDVDYIWHQEDDFTFNEPVNIDLMISILEARPNLWQLALKRQPVNAEEAAVGGFMELAPETYFEHGFIDSDAIWLEHRNFFTLNPCLYPISITRPLWPEGGGEKEFGERIFQNPEVMCGYLGTVADEPKVNHIGNYRTGEWTV